MESDWRSGFECLLRHQGILQDNRFLLAFLGVRSLERKNSVVSVSGFQRIFRYFVVFKCLGVDLRALEKIQRNQGMKRNRHQLIFRPFCQGLVLKILNMRPTFAISPLAVIHGGKGAAGLWEVPETTRIILCPGDRLIFIEPHPEDGKKFQMLDFDSWVWQLKNKVKHFLMFFFHIYLEPKWGHHILEDLGIP